jgi:hypothetical protein
VLAEIGDDRTRFADARGLMADHSRRRGHTGRWRLVPPPRHR